MFDSGGMAEMSACWPCCYFIAEERKAQRQLATWHKPLEAVERSQAWATDPGLPGWLVAAALQQPRAWPNSSHEARPSLKGALKPPSAFYGCSVPDCSVLSHFLVLCPPSGSHGCVTALGAQLCPFPVRALRKECILLYLN